jgi:Prp8 binding protein
MSGEKRPAPEGFGTSHQLVVKRSKADADLNAGTALVKGSSQNGAVVQSVCAIVTLKAWRKWKN